MTNKSYYITTPIYYVNEVPHIGHAYTNIASDVIARFMRLAGRDVRFLSGTDEHGLKVEKSALSKNIDPLTYVNQVSGSFRKLMKILNISNDDFIRTTEERHKKGAVALWNSLLASGDIYLSSYKGWYSTRDEAFYSESELTEDGRAPTGADVEWVEEPSYFFALSKWQDKLLAFYEQNPDFIKPNSRRNEVISFVKSGLTDLSISRCSFKWGIQVPDNKEHVIYVWLDALTNYISALGYPDSTELYKKFWPANVHIIGKDILRFHAVYWPAFLMSAGIPLPQSIMAHGWWANEGQKISKSIGNVIDPFQLVQEFGVDSTRYYLMREMIFGSDGNYSRTSLINRINSELSNKIGNLQQRTIAFVYKNNHGRMPLATPFALDITYKTNLMQLATKIAAENISLMEEFKINAVLDNIVRLAEAGNIYIDTEAPWTLREVDTIRMHQVTYTLLEACRYIAIMLLPFIPESAAKMLDQLRIPEAYRSFLHLTSEYPIVPEIALHEPSPIFPRYQEPA